MGTYYKNYIKIVDKEENCNIQKVRITKLLNKIVNKYMEIDSEAYPTINVYDFEEYIYKNIKSHEYANMIEYYIYFDFKYGNMEFYKKELLDFLNNQEKNLSLNIFTMEKNNSNDLSGFTECKEENYKLYDKIKKLEIRE